MADFNGTFWEACLDMEPTGDDDFEIETGEGVMGATDCLLSSGGFWGGVLEIKLSRLLGSRCIGGGVLCFRSRAVCGGDIGSATGYTTIDPRRLASEYRTAFTAGSGSGTAIGAG